MAVYKGHTSTIFQIPPQSSNYIVKTFIISNTGAANFNVDLFITNSGGGYHFALAPVLSLAPGTAYTDENIEVLPNEVLQLTVSGGTPSCDYYFYYAYT